MHSAYNNTHSTANSPEAPALFDLSRVEVGDAFITLRHWPGNGPIVVLVHGISSSGFSWEPLIPSLAERFSPVTIDLRGHGASGKPATGYLYGNYVSDLDHVLDALGEDRPLIMGHSLGGIIALWWAARYPDRAAGLVIVDSPLRSGRDFSPAFEGWLEENAMPVAALAARYCEERPEWTEAQVLRRANEMASTPRTVFTELWADSLAMDGIDRIAEIEHITSPILFVQGDHESGGMVHPADAITLEERLANTRVIHWPGSGHSLHLQRPDDFLALAVPFLQECARIAAD